MSNHLPPTKAPNSALKSRPNLSRQNMAFDPSAPSERQSPEIQRLSGLQRLASASPAAQRLSALQRAADTGSVQVKAVSINDDAGLEKEADVMGGRAVQLVQDLAPTDMPLQLCKGKKKKTTGKKGLSYGSIAGTYSQEEIEATGKSVSAHGTGGSGSNQSAKTTKETAELVAALRENREKKKAESRPKPTIKNKGAMDNDEKIRQKIAKLNNDDELDLAGRLEQFDDYWVRRGYEDEGYDYDDYADLIDL